MKKTILAAVCAGFISINATAVVSSSNVVGYTTAYLSPGDNLVCNAFHYPPNQLSTVIPDAPLGTTVSLWDSSLNNYYTTSTYTVSGWSDDLTLDTGAGALLNTPAAFTNIWNGNVLDGDGTYWDGDGFPSPPPAFSGPDGTYLLGFITPVGPQTGEDVFLWTLGRNPNIGEQIRTLDPDSQVYTTTAYLGSGSWDNGIPELGNAESAFFVIPEPSSIALIGLVGGCGVFVRRFFAV